MTFYDHIVIGFYLAFALLLGTVYKGFNKTASDYFRGGGGIPEQPSRQRISPCVSNWPSSTGKFTGRNSIGGIDSSE